DIDMRVMLPGYPEVMAALGEATVIRRYRHLFGTTARLLAASFDGLHLIVLDAPRFFDRPGNPYFDADGVDWLDNWKRFAAFARAAADIASGAVDAFVPDVVHCHDWQAGLVPAYLHFGRGGGARSVMTIHNIAFQGRFDSAIFSELGLPPEAYAVDGVEFYGGVGYLKAGLLYADAITTVSPTYAREICTPEGGMGLDGLLRGRQAALSGIVNGIDTEVWDPESDSHLASPYSARRLGARKANKREVESAFGLDPGDGPLFCVVSRLAWQKGMDLLDASIEPLVAAGARLAVIGSGDPGIEAMLRAGAARHPGRIGIITGYHEELSHLLQGGADAILIPSRFEPCGLTQLYGLRYGCVPVVARVGGLADTVIDANLAALEAGVATGIQFSHVDAEGLKAALLRAVDLYRDPGAWQRIQKNGMKTDVSWRASAARYADLYRGNMAPG
ncbi:MAG: glycogen synthase GlgA, partial [Bauldia sp.]|nr:glycogen synthase GlgA [Bauldia sp.]